MSKKSDSTQTILKNLNKEIKNIQGVTNTALKAAGMAVIGTAIPLTPIDTSNLRKSFGVYSPKNTKKPQAVIYNTANYAIYVHERTELNHKVGQAKFLSSALKLTPVFQIIKNIVNKRPRTKK